MTRRVMMKDILAEVAAKHRVRPSDILGPRRFRPIVRARQEAMFRCRTEAGKTLPQIGSFFRKDHTTVLYDVRRYQQRIGGSS